ncbi:hypothetical protein CRE_05487 [Caenorhabditis remanei]|uniref:Uncharacterized protein n=1 Tax=Caenorhabditis remanei TaxID=31234 RepID=E3LZJ8_CAERE|nr:hypothetical protein CRE_05487 [Caenorhabditis remanei]
MVNGEEEDPNVRYWKTKYDLLHEDYGRTKERTEDLESRLLEVVEESERKDHEKDKRIRQLEIELEEANRRIEQLEEACFRYKNQNKPPTTSSEFKATEPIKLPMESEETESNELKKVDVQRTMSGISTRSSIDGITRSPEFHAGQHMICEYHKLPILAKGEGFIYGFRWNFANKIHII